MRTTLPLLLSLCSCVGLGTAIEMAGVDCGAPAVQQALPALLPQVTTSLSSSSPNAWQPELTTLELAGGDAVFCAVGVVIQGLESGTIRLAIASGSPDLAVLRGEMYLSGWHLQGKTLRHRVAR